MNTSDDPGAKELNNLFEEAKSVKPNYDVKKDRRYLDILCFPEGKVILHGHYDYNYSFCYFAADDVLNVDLSVLLENIISGEWEHFYRFTDAVELDHAADKYSAYILKYYLNDGKITRYSPVVIFEPVGTIENDGTAGKVIDKAIKDIYAEKVEYDEAQVMARLADMKRMIAESDDRLFEQTVLPIERELSKMQYLVFGSAQIRALYKECRTLTANKYNAYMTLVR